jgi:predicted transcriptional regulator
MNESGKHKPAKICYEHIGGKLGELLMEQFVTKGWISKYGSADKHFYITEKGEHEFSELGIDLTQIKSE